MLSSGFTFLARSTTLLWSPTALSAPLPAPPSRSVLANNDVPTGTARIPLEAVLPADWEGWSGGSSSKRGAPHLACCRIVVRGPARSRVFAARLARSLLPLRWLQGIPRLTFHPYPYPPHTAAAVACGFQHQPAAAGHTGCSDAQERGGTVPACSAVHAHLPAAAGQPSQPSGGWGRPAGGSDMAGRRQPPAAAAPPGSPPAVFCRCAAPGCGAAQLRCPAN